MAPLDQLIGREIIDGDDVGNGLVGGLEPRDVVRIDQPTPSGFFDVVDAGIVQAVAQRLHGGHQFKGMIETGQALAVGCVENIDGEAITGG